MMTARDGINVAVNMRPDSTSGNRECLRPYCAVCIPSERQAPYSCPKCSIPYCSLACYKKHDTSCTESFYQDRVNQELKLSAKERRDEMNRIIKRVHQTYSAIDDSAMMVDDDNDNNNCCENGENDDTKELLRLMDALEKMDQEAAISFDEVKRLMSVSMRKRFLADVQAGRLNDDILDSWHPWWIPRLGGREEAIADNMKQMEAALDVRLLRVPSFSTLSKRAPTPLLVPNLLEVLLCVAETLRSFHGVENAIAISGDAANYLFQHSSVLHKDSRFDSVEEVLQNFSRKLSSKSRLWPWEVIAKDVVCLWTTKRHVGHALLDATTILKEAEREFRTCGDKEHASILRKARKKVEFFLSWSRAVEWEEQIAQDIEAWVEEWGPQPQEDVSELEETKRKRTNLLINPTPAFLDEVSQRQSLVQEYCG